MIREEFGVAYVKGHVSRLLAPCIGRPRHLSGGPASGMNKRSRTGRESAWPRVFKRVRTERRERVFVDQAGVYLLLTVVKTYAPCARTPVLRAKLTRDHLSVMARMTAPGRVCTLARQESFNGSHCVEFLVDLQRVAARRLMVIWEGSPKEMPGPSIDQRCPFFFLRVLRFRLESADCYPGFVVLLGKHAISQQMDEFHRRNPGEHPMLWDGGWPRSLRARLTHDAAGTGNGP